MTSDEKLGRCGLARGKRALDFGKLPSTGLGPELAEGSRAARWGWAGENSGLSEQPADDSEGVCEYPGTHVSVVLK
jgi:hypothetical protein